MRIQNRLLLPFIASFFISCGDTTTSSPLIEIESIHFDETNISIYATDLEKELTATVVYDDNSTANGAADMLWSSSDTNVVYAYGATVVAAGNGGDANITISYADTFEDTTSVHVKELQSINYTDINISDIGTPQVVYFSGNFENNETNITMKNNIIWTIDANATLSDINETQLTITVDYNTTSITLFTTLFSGTENEVDFNKTFY